MKKIMLICTPFALMVACSKHDSNRSTQSITGNWENSNWGGTANNILIFTVASGGTNGTITQLGTNTYGFSVNDILYSNITSAGNGVYNATGTYRYGPNGSNVNVGQAACVLTLQNNGSTLYAHYSTDPSTGFTPPDYYYQKQ